MWAGEMRGEEEERKSTELAHGDTQFTTIYGDFLWKEGWLLAPASSISNLAPTSDICQHSARTTEIKATWNQGRSQFVLAFFKSSHPYQLLKREGENIIKFL